jgi:transposase
MVRRRKFSDEYKREAVRLATQPGVTKSQVAQELGINANLLGRWCRDFAANGAAAFPGQGKPRDEEMASLKRELSRVKKERDFLREAATFFAKESK